MENALSLDTVLLSENGKDIIILDQTLLPNECKYLTLNKAEDIWEAIKKLRVRGAPAIGVCGSYAYYILADQLDTDDMNTFVAKCKEQMEYINSSRPTAARSGRAPTAIGSVPSRRRPRQSRSPTPSGVSQGISTATRSPGAAIQLMPSAKKATVRSRSPCVKQSRFARPDVPLLRKLTMRAISAPGTQTSCLPCAFRISGVRKGRRDSAERSASGVSPCSASR